MCYVGTNFCDLEILMFSVVNYFLRYRKTPVDIFKNHLTCHKQKLEEARFLLLNLILCPLKRRHTVLNTVFPAILVTSCFDDNLVLKYVFDRKGKPK